MKLSPIRIFTSLDLTSRLAPLTPNNPRFFTQMESQALCQLRDERKQMVQPTMQAYQALGEMTTQDADVHRAHYNLKTTEARNALKPAQTQAKFQLIGLEAIRS